MATFKDALEYAAKNPNSDFAIAFGKEVATGKHDIEASRFGVDTTPIKNKYKPLIETQTENKKDTLLEKISGFTGGKQLAQGLGQALANKKIGEQTKETQKQQFDIQNQLINRIKEEKALGKDTTRLEQALGMISEDIRETGEKAGELLNQEDITGKQVIGSTLQLGATLAGAGTIGKGATAVSKATTAGKGAMAGLKTGATSGAIYGGVSGVASGLEEDKSAIEIAQKGIGGALTGAAVGGALGAATGAVSGKIKGRAIEKAKKKDEFVLDLVSPRQTSEYKIQAQKEGRVSEAGLLKPSKILASKKDKELAKVVSDIVDPRLSPQQNLDLIDKNVDDITANVRAYVKANKVPFNTNQLTKQLNKGKDKLNLIFASDKQAEKTYNAVVKEFIKNVENKDTSGLLLGRQGFDKVPAIKKLLESQGLGENTKREIVRQVRSSANDYVASLLPKGNKYKEALLTQTRMIEVIDNIAEKNIDRIGRNKIQYLVKKYPWLKAAAYFTAGAIGTSIGIGAIGAATGKGE